MKKFLEDLNNLEFNDNEKRLGSFLTSMMGCIVLGYLFKDDLTLRDTIFASGVVSFVYPVFITANPIIKFRYETLKENLLLTPYIAAGSFIGINLGQYLK